MQEPADQFSFLLIHPLYRDGAALETASQRREYLRGYTTEVIRVGDLVEQALAILKPGGIDIAVFDDSGALHERFLYFHPSRRREQPVTYAELYTERSDTLRHVSEFELAGRNWSIESRAIPGIFSVATPTEAWGALVGGLAFTLLLLGYLVIMRRHAARLSADRDNLEKRVQERTTELETAHQELLRQERLAALGQLTGTVAHELRNPLSTVLNSIEVIDKKTESDAVKRNLDRARRNIARCDRIITELLDFGRARGPILQSVPVDHWLREQLEHFDVPGNVTFEQHLHADEAVVDMDADMLSQALTNIFTNACHAAAAGDQAPGDARVTLRSRVANHVVYVEVEDNGPGIPESELPRVREPLYSTKSFGIGLGLSIVQRVMQQHDGGFELFSQVGKGTRAVLSLATSRAH